VDGRGCLNTGRVIDRFSGNWYGYFHTEISSDTDRQAVLEVSTANQLILWMNGEPLPEVKGQKHIWYDFLDNPEHKGSTVAVQLKKGVNHLLILVRGGRYGGDGFYAACLDLADSGNK